MKRRSVIVKGLAASMTSTIARDTHTTEVQLRDASAPQAHLGVSPSVWLALLDRVDGLMQGIHLALCGEKFDANGYLFPPQGNIKGGNWRMHVDEAARARLSPRAVLLSSRSLESRLAGLVGLRVNAVSLVAAVGIYHCEGEFGGATLLMPCSSAPPRVLAVVLNESPK